MLESTRRVDTVVLDKTGTVTTGRMSWSTSCPPRASPPTRSPPRGGRRGRLRAPDRAGAVAASGVGALPAVDGLRERRRASASRGDRRGPDRRRRPRRGCSPTRGLAAADRPRRRGRRTPSRAAARRSPSAGTAVPAACSWSPTPSSRRPREAVARAARPRPEPVLLTGDNERAARAVAAEVGIDRRDRRGAARRQGRRRRRAPGRGPRRRDGRRRRQRRRRAGPGRPRASRWAPAPTSRSRRAT